MTRTLMSPGLSYAAALFSLITHLSAGVGDPQVRTDHPWYPGELACSTFERLFLTQAEQYRRVTGVEVKTDADRALASWFWRNTHFAHGEEGAEDWWGAGFGKGGDARGREYWTGLFAHGFGLCGTTHSQWTAEFESLLGHGRARGAGVKGHNSFEAFLTGGPYGDGRWALLDHDLSTVIFDPTGQRLLSLREVQGDWRRLVDRTFSPEKQNGWLVCGLHPADGLAYQKFDTAEYLAGYAGPPPLVHLRAGERLRRYLQPGMEDGRTFAFWGRNYRDGGIAGPARAETWVNQPEKMRGSREGAGHRLGGARYGNAVYEYQPDFVSGGYRDGLVEETERSVTFEFVTPFIIGVTPPNDAPWGVYDAGGRNGLTLHGAAKCKASVSVDRGRTWSPPEPMREGLDLTDHVKGRRQYLLRLDAPVKELAGSEFRTVTVCQVNAAILPRLKDDGTVVNFLASDRAIVSAGPNREQARTHLVAGGFDTPGVTLELRPPRGEPVVAVHAAAQLASSNPPSPDVKYHIEYSIDGGKAWLPIVKDWTIPRRGEEPADFWSQSLCFGSIEIAETDARSVQVRFTNTGGKKILRAEAHLVYRAAGGDATRVTFDWTESAGPRRESHVFAAGPQQGWRLATGKGVQTRWVEFESVPAKPVK
jgi:hypothetical protein